ncbi:MAG TPA: MoaD/ThiS family protein [Aquabacterium sp.]|nr:MoaD/ThiS family protein [Aquabacterium sp.]
MADTITIHTDRGDLTLHAPCSLADAVDQLLQGTQRDASHMATAVNGEFVARADRADRWLVDGDTVLCFAPITGG